MRAPTSIARARRTLHGAMSSGLGCWSTASRRKNMSACRRAETGFSSAFNQQNWPNGARSRTAVVSANYFYGGVRRIRNGEHRLGYASSGDRDFDADHRRDRIFVTTNYSTVCCLNKLDGGCSGCGRSHCTTWHGGEKSRPQSPGDSAATAKLTELNLSFKPGTVPSSELVKSKYGQ